MDFRGRATTESLAAILRYFPPLLFISHNPAVALLQEPDVASQISTLLLRPDFGAVNDNLCAWLYDTFNSSEPNLQLDVLSFLPIYVHETVARNGQAATVSLPDLSHASIYHETKQPTKNASTELHLTANLEPHDTVRSTRRAKIVGVALELYFSKISQIPVDSKL